MKKGMVSVLLVTGLLSVLLSGCEPGGGADGGMEETEAATGNQESALPYQFARSYGIVRSKHPVYELESVIEAEIPQKEKIVTVSAAVFQNQELIVSLILDDFEAEKSIAGGDETVPRYQDELWRSGEGLFLTGPGIPEGGLKPEDSVYASYTGYLEAYGNKRYFIEARFELLSVPDDKERPLRYAVQILDFEQPVEFALKPVPQYATLEELAAREHGSIDIHDGIPIISMGQKAKEGLLINWYVYREAEDASVALIYQPPHQEVDLPTVSGNGKEYPIKQLAVHPYLDSIGSYRLSEMIGYGRRTKCLFDVPEKEQDTTFRIEIPGITFLNRDESIPVTLPVPAGLGEYEEVNEDIPWDNGSVRILGITRMKEAQNVQEPYERDEGKKSTVQRPAVYIDVEAVHKEKDLELRGLICQRKRRWSGWENQRYDFDEDGNLSGFRILYDEGDTEVTLKFHSAAFYWNQPYVMEIPKPD